MHGLQPGFVSEYRYKERWGDMNVPRRYWEDWALGIWVSDVRTAGRQQWLTPSQMCLLEESQFSFKVSGVCKCLLHLKEHNVVRGTFCRNEMMSLRLAKLLIL